MKILNADQIRAWDQFTIENEPVTSIHLMERAALACFNWLKKEYLLPESFAVICGKGNNGGDGLALARLLADSGRRVSVYILEFGNKGTDDFQANLERLHLYPAVEISFIQSADNFPLFSTNSILIDALFGSGLSRPLADISEALVEHINKSGCTIISIDIPSGLSVDQSSKGNTSVHADHTLSFQCYKTALLIAENAGQIGKVHVLDIGLHPGFEIQLVSSFELIDEKLISGIYKKRKPFSHKGDFGHALLVAGCYGRMGAAILAAEACLRTGVGLLTVHIPKSGYDILQVAVPEAMVNTDSNSSFPTNIDLETAKINAVGIGPGIGTASETRGALKKLFSDYALPIVLDADALNCISMEKNLLKSIPPASILTPHPKEFERLFGKTENDFKQIELAVEKAKKLDVIIVLKGHHTFIATPGGLGYFNDTGNAGMATAGSGDVLTGILTSLVAQGYDTVQAAVLGVYLHGLAGDIAAEMHSQEAMIAGDISECLADAFQQIQQY